MRALKAAGRSGLRSLYNRCTIKNILCNLDESKKIPAFSGQSSPPVFHKKEASMTKAEEFFIKLTSQTPNVKEGKMFGALCMKTPNGKSGAMFWKDSIVVKLSAEPLQEALSLEGAKLFEPMEGKPMKEWVQIPFIHKSKWKKFADISIASVRELKKKIPVKKKK